LKPDKDLDRETYYLRCFSMSCWNLSYDKQTQKQKETLAYADDIDIVGRSQSAVRDAYLALEIEAAKVGLDGWIVSGGVALLHAGHKTGLMCTKVYL
jgi:hypothetical protein